MEIGLNQVYRPPQMFFELTYINVLIMMAQKKIVNFNSY